MQPAAPIQYRTVEEVVEDGPFYVLDRGGEATVAWDELPELDDEDSSSISNAMLATPSGDSNVPLYENHWPSAQMAWED